MVIVRKAVESDFYKGHIELYKQLSDTIESISEEQYRYIIGAQSEHQSIFVIENIPKNKIVGTVTVLIEQKFIHNFGKVGHIEDIIIDSAYRNNKYGSELIEFAKEYAKQKKCYKIILNCNTDKVGFYEKCEFAKKSDTMAIYFEK